MRKDYSHIVIVADRSGSMASILDDTIGGYNAFLKTQKEQPGTATITFVKFDEVYEELLRMKPLAEAVELNHQNFVPRGSTALYDAIGKTIATTGEDLAKLDEADRPEHVIVVILTDGQENASSEYSGKRIKEMISHQTDAYKWQFIFMGSNQDAIKTADTIGIMSTHAITYANNADGVAGVFTSTAEFANNVRAGVKGVSYTEADRQTQTKAGV